MLARQRAERCEQGSVDEQVGFGIEVAAEHGLAPRETGKLPVGIVQHGLHLEQDRGENEVAVRSS